MLVLLRAFAVPAYWSDTGVPCSSCEDSPCHGREGEDARPFRGPT